MDHRVKPGGDDLWRRSILGRELNPLPAARGAGGDIDAEVLKLLASALHRDFQLELVTALKFAAER
jgi:hypothetical protein